MWDYVDQILDFYRYRSGAALEALAIMAEALELPQQDESEIERARCVAIAAKLKAVKAELNDSLPL
jgi:hypothetical protein